jgi:hypothetical protein
MRIRTREDNGVRFLRQGINSPLGTIRKKYASEDALTHGSWKEEEE